MSGNEVNDHHKKLGKASLGQGEPVLRHVPHTNQHRCECPTNCMELSVMSVNGANSNSVQASIPGTGFELPPAVVIFVALHVHALSYVHCNQFYDC